MSTFGSTSGDIDLGKLGSALLRHWLAIVVVAMAAGGAAFVLAALATPQYRAETTVAIVQSLPTQKNGDTAGSRLVESESIDTQIGIFTSSDLLNNVIGGLEKSDPVRLSEFDDAATLSPLDRLLIRSGLKGNPADIPLQERVLERFRDSLKVYRGKQARTIIIEFSSRDPKMASEVPQLIAATYKDFALRAQSEETTGAVESLSSEIEALSARVKSAETRVADFEVQPDLRGALTESATATQLQSELTRTRANRAAAEADAERVKRALEDDGSFPNVLSSSLIQHLRMQQTRLHGDIAALSADLPGNQPRISVIREQLSDIDQQIGVEAEKVLRGLSNIAKAAKLREDQLVADLDHARAEAARAEDRETELRSLQREAAAAREQLESYRARYRQAQSRSSSNYLPADALAISTPAIPQEPYFPKPGPITGAALGIAILLMSIFILARELFSGKARRPAHETHFEPVEQVQMPVVEPSPTLAAASAVQREDDGQLTDHGEVGVHEAAQMLIAGGATRALFVSPQGDEAAASAVMVARGVADAGLRVLLVDLTTVGAPSAPMLDGLPLLGITDLLAGSARFTDVIHEDHYSDCHVIPVGQADQRLAMRAVGQLPMILDTLNAAYDVVIVECGSAHADSIYRLVSEGTEILVSVLQPLDEIAGAREDLASGNYEGLTLVTPANDISGPYADRTAA